MFEVDRATIYRWEKGRQNVPRSVLLALEGLEFARRYRELKADYAKHPRRAP